VIFNSATESVKGSNLTLMLQEDLNLQGNIITVKDIVRAVANMDPKMEVKYEAIRIDGDLSPIPYIVRNLKISGKLVRRTVKDR